MAARIFGNESIGGLAALGAAGLASAAALILIASNRIQGLGPDLVTPMLLAIQWHLVGLTLAKFGIDYALFAIISRHRDKTFRLRSALAFPVLPCLGAFALASLVLFPPLLVALLAVAVFADTMSTFRQAELNAKRHFRTSAIGTLLNYPLFLIVWGGIAYAGETSLAEGFAAFALSSLARWGWFELRHARLARGATPVALTVKGMIGAQGALNLLLFRSDQIVLAVLLFVGASVLANHPMLPAYVFLARVPELATGLLVLAGTVYFPLRHLEAPPADSAPALRFYGVAAVLAALAGAAATAVIIRMFVGSAPSLAWCLPFVAQIPLILLANLATYSMQSQSYLPALIRNLCIACAGGAAVAIAAAVVGSLVLLSWVVPVQLAIFFVLARAATWGRPIALFEEAHAA